MNYFINIIIEKLEVILIFSKINYYLNLLLNMAQIACIMINK